VKNVALDELIEYTHCPMRAYYLKTSKDSGYDRLISPWYKIRDAMEAEFRLLILAASAGKRINSIETTLNKLIDVAFKSEDNLKKRGPLIEVLRLMTSSLYQDFFYGQYKITTPPTPLEMSMGGNQMVSSAVDCTIQTGYSDARSTRSFPIIVLFDWSRKKFRSHYNSILYKAAFAYDFFQRNNQRVRIGIYSLHDKQMHYYDQIYDHSKVISLLNQAAIAYHDERFYASWGFHCDSCNFRNHCYKVTIK